ncbi:hypothetical protein NGM10_05665 [Halorussus salilacus]|uniref:hypothetical protein n=1 Tax=Halorussus salilacus TaxID=2953750 RepID=UPI0020A15F41|nr:hypothetical protein [Halorussus salilacus]USZ69227.1 hypothetical protein NGM10_05665 [Halorussus salilacus]
MNPNREVDTSADADGDAVDANELRGLGLVGLYASEQEFDVGESTEVRVDIAGPEEYDGEIAADVEITVPSGVRLDADDGDSATDTVVSRHVVLEPGGEETTVSVPVRGQRDGEHTVAADVTYYPVGHEERSRSISGLEFWLTVGDAESDADPAVPREDSDGKADFDEEADFDWDGYDSETEWTTESDWSSTDDHGSGFGRVQGVAVDLGRWAQARRITVLKVVFAWFMVPQASVEVEDAIPVSSHFAEVGLRAVGTLAGVLAGGAAILSRPGSFLTHPLTGSPPAGDASVLVASAAIASLGVLLVAFQFVSFVSPGLFDEERDGVFTATLALQIPALVGLPAVWALGTALSVGTNLCTAVVMRGLR